jgi:hypothetical protein
MDQGPDLQVEHLDPVRPAVGHEQPARGEVQAEGRAALLPLGQKPPLAVEDLHAVVLAVADVDAPLGVEADGVW